MKVIIVLVTAAVMVLSLSLGFSMMASQQAAPSAIEGIILKAGTGEPLSKATVELQGGPTVLSTTTERDGRFYFPIIAAGTYRILVRRDGHWPAEFGQRWVDGPGQPLAVEPGQQVSNVQIPMTPSGVISGRITGLSGEPLAGARVRAMKPWIQENQRMLRVVQEAVANDLGEYRLIWLLPGTYYISATWVDSSSNPQLVINPDAAGAPNVSRSAPRPVTSRPLTNGLAENEVYAPIYFPAAPDSERALALNVQSGAEYSGVDIRLTPTQAFHVRGRVTNPPPPAAAAPGGARGGGGARGARGTQVRLAPLTPNGPTYSANADPESGMFDFPRVVPGGYVSYLFIDGMTIRDPVNVRSADVNGVSLTVSPGMDIPVNLTFDGDPPPNFPDLTGLRVTLWRDPTLLNAPAMPANAGGTATLTNIAPGDYRVYVNPLLSALNGNNPPAVQAAWQNAYIKSMRLDGEDVLNGGLHLVRELGAPLEVVVGAKPGAIGGRVLSEGLEAIPSAVVTLLAADPAVRIYRTDMYKVGQTDASGRFRFPAVPPGAYKVFAWGGVERGSWMDPNFIGPYEGAAPVVQVEEGMEYSVDLSLITVR